jgi:hypothetical protein
MTEKQFWIADTEGVKARVTGVEARDQWVKVHGWSDTTEPVGHEFQWVRNVDHGGKGVMNHEAALLHEGLGWFPSGPSGYDEPAEPKSSPAPKSASSGDKKE